MHCNWRDIISQHTLLLQSECTHRCIPCKLWTDYPLPDDGLVQSTIGTLLEDNRFFDHFPRTRLYNVIGGEPLINQDIPRLLSTLKAAGIYIRLWTHGIVPADHWAQVYPLIDEVVLYLPAPESVEYRTITGTDGFHRIVPLIKDLRSHGIRVALNAAMSPLMVEWLPYFHDLARDNRLPMIVTYYGNGDYTPTEIDYIHRYNWVLRTATIRLPKRHKHSCPGVPHAALQSPIEMGRLYGKGLIDIIRVHLKI